jgi:hypothetical protein
MEPASQINKKCQFHHVKSAVTHPSRVAKQYPINLAIITIIIIEILLSSWSHRILFLTTEGEFFFSL